MNTVTDHQILKDKVDELNKSAWEIRVSDSNIAEQLSKEAVDLSESFNYTKGKAEGYRTLGFSCIRLSKNTEALGYLQKALALFEELNDVRGQSTVYEYFGIINRSLGNLSASLQHLLKGLELARLAEYREGESLAMYHLGVTYKYLGNYEQALEHLLQSLAIARNFNFWVTESYSINLIGQVYFENGDYTCALDYYNQSLQLRRKLGDKWGEAGCLDNIGLTHLKINDYGEAENFFAESFGISEAIGDKKGQGNALLHLGLITQKSKNFEEAIDYGNRSLQIRRDIGDKKGEAEILLFLAGLYLKENNNRKDYHQAFDLLNMAIQLGNETQAADLIANIHFGFYEAFKQIGKYDEALKHLEENMKLSKEIHNEAVNKKIQNLEIFHRIEKSRQEAEIYRLRNIELSDLYEESKRQKEKIEIQKKMVEGSFNELKEFQAQLIQREKMASLGELTAGIAHEIQNPLNFVNNFSEVSTELVAEMKEELTTGNKQQAISIADDLIENLQKINHHGKRADAIVKGMLQHSRASTGKKEPTDINALADEYMRLSYHGLRAKDKDFNANFTTEFDEGIGRIEVVPQDIGRVLLNLYNNAFYSVNEKKKAPSLKGENYEPTVWVKTKRISSPPAGGAWVLEISIKDNGTGIPQKVLDKIFQPFFTTKPTGEGTGLGLSLSYDIMKAHGGELKVETKEGEGAEFIVHLPYQNTVQ